MLEKWKGWLGHSEAVPQRPDFLGHRFAMPQPPTANTPSSTAATGPYFAGLTGLIGVVVLVAKTTSCPSTSTKMR